MKVRWPWGSSKKRTALPQNQISERLAALDAELGGIALAGGLPLLLAEETPNPGSPAWAVQSAILEKFPSMQHFQAMLDELEPVQQQGWINLLKGRAAEHLVAFDTGGTLHTDWNVPDHDVITPEGDLIQVKTGTVSYIESTLDDIDPDLLIHTGVEGRGIKGIEAHDWSDDELERALANLDSIEADTLDFLTGGLVMGTVLSAASVTRQIRAGGIQLNEAPRFLVVDALGRGARCAVIGISLSSGSPIIVSAATAYILYRARFLLKMAVQSGVRIVRFSRVSEAFKAVSKGTLWAVSHRNTRKAVAFTVRSSWRIIKGAVGVTRRTIQWSRR